MVAARSAALALVALCGLATPSVAGDEGRGRRSIPYSEAREAFRRLGYRPYLMPGADVCDPNDPRCFPELEYCAKSRTWACTYTWRRGAAIIEVETRYDNPVVAHSECVLNCKGGAARNGDAARQHSADEDVGKTD